MTAGAPDFQVKLADCAAELEAAQRLRYRVFVTELGGDGPQVDHTMQLERDRYDPYFDHLLLLDRNRVVNDQVVGLYRLLRADRAGMAGGFYSETEYDLGVLKQSGRRLLELGRSCLRADYRGGTAMYELWSGLASYVAQHKIEILFGVASFHGTDVNALAQPLSFLHHRHLAPPNLQVTAKPPGAARMDLLAADQIDRRGAMLKTPALIKAYLRLGGYVGQGAWIDRAFNTTDVCLVMDTERMNERQRGLYTHRRAGA